MEAILLDSAHGFSDINLYELEQHWVVDGEDIIRITVRYVSKEAAKLASSAELVLLTGMTEESANNPATVLRLRAFPWQWWRLVGLDDYPGNEAPMLLEEVAKGLLDRYTAMYERGEEAAKRN